MNIRSSGVLLPISCLPTSFGIGDLGPAAYRFVDLLHESKQRFWQILPLNPTVSTYCHSPYHSTSAFAFNPLLISPELLLEEGLITADDLAGTPAFPAGQVDYETVSRFKLGLLDCVYQRHRQRHHGLEFKAFCDQNAPWLDDFALFTACKTKFPGDKWDSWPDDIRSRKPQALERLASDMADEMERTKLWQYLFFKQWTQLKHYCRSRSVHVFGDMPIYMPFDCTDVWAHRDLFKLDGHSRPTAVSGVPPDYFSATGQLWGHPVYDWQVHQKTRYDWWIKRLAHNLMLFDYLRIDHFRGLVAYWEVPADEATAMNGKWIEVPVADFFDEVMRRFACTPIVAEDLGVITPDVREIMGRYGFPGMRILLFGFSDDVSANPNAPHNIVRQCVVYTGTHDNNTVKGWFKMDAGQEEKRALLRYLGRPLAVDELPWELIRLAMMSPAVLSVIPMQDLLGLDGDARINRPGRMEDNWLWRMSANQMADFPKDRLREMTEIYGRT
jgi:4-alpha-glucanotransferase